MKQMNGLKQKELPKYARSIEVNVKGFRVEGSFFDYKISRIYYKNEDLREKIKRGKEKLRKTT